MRISSLARWTTRGATALVLSALVVAGPVTAGPNANSTVLPISSKPYGKSYADWSAIWWQWAFSMPVDEHPLFDTAPASEGQTGKVWFLGGTFTVIELNPDTVLGQADRTVTVPFGTSLFFPILNAEASDIEGNGTTEDELRAAAQFFADFIDPDNLFLEIDGKPATRLDRYRVQSPLIEVGPLPENNLLGAPGGTIGMSVADGYYAMLRPLSVGEHTIKFGGFVDLRSIGGPLFILDITYTVTVAPRN